MTYINSAKLFVYNKQVPRLLSKVQAARTASPGCSVHAVTSPGSCVTGVTAGFFGRFCRLDRFPGVIAGQIKFTAHSAQQNSYTDPSEQGSAWKTNLWSLPFLQHRF